MKRIILGILTILLMLGFSGCSDNKDLNGLIKHFEKNEMSGTLRKAKLDKIKAIDGSWIISRNFMFVVYEYNDDSEIHPNKHVFQNGRFELMIDKPTKSTNERLYNKIIDTFKDY